MAEKLAPEGFPGDLKFIGVEASEVGDWACQFRGEAVQLRIRYRIKMECNDEFSSVSNGQKKKHVLVVPFPTHAHVAAIYRLALQLAERGVTITFVTHADEAPKMRKYEELQGLDFNFITYAESVVQIPAFQFPAIVGFASNLAEVFEPILQELQVRQKAGQSPPTCIIYDRFCTGVADISEKLRIPYYTFYSNGAVFARYMQEAPRLLTDGNPFVSNGDGTFQLYDGLVNIPGLPPIPGPYMLESSFSNPSWRIRTGRVMHNAPAVIINTFYELEKPQIDEIRRQCAEQAAASGRKKSEVFLVGPLSEAATFKDRSFVPGVSQSENGRAECLQWLDTQKPQSVIFICMGSMGRWKPTQVEELALALEAADVSFLWVLTSSREALPAGFEQRLNESGKGYLASGWVPQLEILQHTAVGGFLSHCGWNSTIESVSLGVPMLCWPQMAEQPLNCRVMVDAVKVGLEVGQFTFQGPGPVGREELERAFRRLMFEEEGKAMRSIAQDLKLKAQTAVAEGGASRRAVDDLWKMIPE
ncbi:hypothetical protein R1sor_021946 [Riccia sorocarpa]|uniref:Glycosyltransferase n=1 Tax=Riccia sorocarpa TaxID=122646 RepID=A0ABD3GIG1_9MARC